MQVPAQSPRNRANVSRLAEVVPPLHWRIARSFYGRTESCADAITSHMFLAENFECTDLHAIARKNVQLQALIYFDKMEFRPGSRCFIRNAGRQEPATDVVLPLSFFISGRSGG